MTINATKRTDIFLIDPRNIVVMDDFNVRRDFDLEELKEQIKVKGVLNPITVIPFKDNGIEKYRLVDGERRYRAVMLAIHEGSDITHVKALKAPKNATMEDLYVEQMMRNEGKRFSEYESGIMFKIFKEDFGYSQVEIAEKFKKSPAFVSKCLSIMNLPKEILDRIEKNHISSKAARDLAASYDSEEEKVIAVNKAVSDAQTKGKATATNKEINAKQRDEKEAKILADSLMKLWAYMDGDVVVNIDYMTNCLSHSSSIAQAVRKYKQNKY